jgi:hypothetical protein
LLDKRRWPRWDNYHKRFEPVGVAAPTVLGIRRSKMCKYPQFYSIKDFAEVTGLSISTLQRAANNYIKGYPDPNNRHRMPAGWGATLWNTVYIVYNEDDAAEIAELFGVETRIAWE